MITVGTIISVQSKCQHYLLLLIIIATRHIVQRSFMVMSTIYIIMHFCVHKQKKQCFHFMILLEIHVNFQQNVNNRNQKQIKNLIKHPTAHLHK